VIGLAGLAVWLSYGLHHQDHLPFYADTPLAADTEPGTLLRIEPISDAPDGVIAYRILYASLGMEERPVAVSGLVVAPLEAAKSGGRPVISWAHFTTGINDPCAPSRSVKGVHVIDGIEASLKNGYIVVATDYIGLGTPGPHPYMVGSVTGRSILDAIRAARSIPDIDADNRTFLWGHSQGGHGVLYAAEIAPRYAPDIDIVGVAAASPPTDLKKVVHNNVGSFFGNILVSYATKSWSEVYDISMQNTLIPHAIPVVSNVAELCIQHLKDRFYTVFDAVELQEGMLTEHALDSSTWNALLERNSIGKLPIVYPIYLAQGSEDALVDPRQTLEFARKVCGEGTDVTFDLVVGAGHNEAAHRSEASVIAWMNALRDAAQPPAGCAGLPASVDTATAG